ncbi:hypothetical protein M0802_009617 [Mischocyttarus mexicanus]|nr:hypothetical protein M0802_009617 [Mischocyttarus mexicanus]
MQNNTSTWLDIQKRFNNHRIIVYTHLWKLGEIASMTRESATEMRALERETEKMFRALKALRLPVDHLSIVLVYLLAEKLDPESRGAWEAVLGENDNKFNRTHDFSSTEGQELDQFLTLEEFV